MKYLAILISLFLVSCESPSDPAPISRTKASLNSPQTIGELPDGRTIKCVVRDMGSEHNHYIYFVDGVSTINYEVPQGKSTRNQVVVEIDGVKYVPAEHQ